MKQFAIPWCVTVAALVVVAGNARAQRRGWHLSAAAVTDVPIDVGGRLALEVPGRVSLSTTVGVMPADYPGAVNHALVGLGAYDRLTGDLVVHSLRGSVVWRTHLGWRPFFGHGFFIEAGYGMVALSGRLSAAEVALAVTGQAGSVPAGYSNSQAEVHSTLHMLDAMIGWQWVVARHLEIRFAVGGAFTLGAQSQVAIQVPGTTQVPAAVATAGAQYLDNTYRTYVHTPTATLSLGYRFF